MRDARAASAADRLHDWYLRRLWKPPPLKRERRPMADRTAILETFGSSSNDKNSGNCPRHN